MMINQDELEDYYMDTLKKGSEGEEVKKLQSLLKIEADGIFGPITEQAVKDFLKSNGLDVDGIVGPATWSYLLGDDDFKITKGYINVHISKLTNRPIKYIAIHYTAGSSSKPGTAMNTRNVFLKRKASADFVVDDATIVLINPDLKNYYCWSVGDKKNPYSKGGQLYGKAKNSNTISIEMCSSLMNGWGAKAANHDGWYISDKVVNNTIKLVKYLMDKFNIPKENVVRHYDISGKLCPGVVGWNKDFMYDNNGKKIDKINNDSEWIKFKNQL